MVEENQPWNELKERPKKNHLFQLVSLYNRILVYVSAKFYHLGVALTTFALVAATVGVKTGNRAYANNMFRLRGKLLFD
jgi:hypothetical protein